MTGAVRWAGLRESHHRLRSLEVSLEQTVRLTTQMERLEGFQPFFLVPPLDDAAAGMSEVVDDLVPFIVSGPLLSASSKFWRRSCSCRKRADLNDSGKGGGLLIARFDFGFGGGHSVGGTVALVSACPEGSWGGGIASL